MPAPATAMASHVRGGWRWCRKTRAKTAVSSGLIDIVTSTLATRVIVSATMKAVNITLQQTPDIHTTRGERSRSAHRPQPRIHVSAMPSPARLNRLRKNVSLEALGRLQRPAHDARGAPHQRDDDHAEGGAGVAQGRRRIHRGEVSQIGASAVSGFGQRISNASKTPPADA